VIETFREPSAGPLRPREAGYSDPTPVRFNDKETLLFSRARQISKAW
jgi:hypothetical protein